MERQGLQALTLEGKDEHQECKRRMTYDDPSSPRAAYPSLSSEVGTTRVFTRVGSIRTPLRAKLGLYRLDAVLRNGLPKDAIRRSNPAAWRASSVEGHEGGQCALRFSSCRLRRILQGAHPWDWPPILLLTLTKKLMMSECVQRCRRIFETARGLRCGQGFPMCSGVRTSKTLQNRSIIPSSLRGLAGQNDSAQPSCKINGSLSRFSQEQNRARASGTLGRTKTPF